MRACFAALATLVACGNEPSDSGSETAEPVQLTPDEQLVRASMAIRGIRPSLDDLAQVDADPAAIDALVSGYLETPEFADMIRDMHAEIWLTRVDLEPPFPSLGPVEEESSWDMYNSISDEPLALVEHIVTSGRPYTDVVTSDYMMADSRIAASFGLDYDPAGPAWQESHWIDGRPHSGVLSSSTIFRRWPSAGNNFERGRANFIASKFLCENFAARDVTLQGNIDLSDTEALATALRTNTACMGCHQALDPIAAAFWGYKQHLDERPIQLAMESGCHTSSPDDDESPFDQRFEDFCYPLRFYTPSLEDMWQDFGLPAPAYYGTPYEGLDGLGQLIADDPRFHECTVRHFAAYLYQTKEADLPLEQVLAHTAAFEASGFDAKQLVKELVLDDAFRTASVDGPSGAGTFTAPVQVIRPEQYARTLADLTGFRWIVDPDGDENCEPYCWREADLTISDEDGFRSMAGGVDGSQVLVATHQPTPIKLLVLERLSAEAAGAVVDSDFALPAAERRLLGQVEPDTLDETAVRGQIAWLHERILGRAVATDSTDVDELFGLFDSARTETDAPSAWKVVIATLLPDPDLLFY
jgi:hypothetical protein